MYRRLIEASDAGDVAKLHNLIRDYPLLLKAAALANGDTALHIACIGGHPHFIREVLNLVPEFTEELNQDGASPLHIAAASGNVEIAMELLGVGSHLCSVKGREKRVPLHFAVAKGRITVINELISLCQDSVTEVTARGETCFHLAVKCNQFEAFKVLCERVVSFGKEDVLNMKDDQGNTPLHLAASTKNYEVVRLLLDGNFVILEVNSTNKKGLTPLDVLESKGGDSEIQEMLTQVGATRGAPSLVIGTQEPSNDEPAQEETREPPKSAFQMLKDYFKYDRIRESPSKARSALLVISILIVTATYQAVLSPPGGVWQDNFSPEKNGSSAKQPPRHTAGLSIMATNSSVSYGLFLLFNSIGFFMSLHMMDILTHGLPLHFELRVALIALISTYNTCMLAITPPGKIYVSFIVFITFMPALLTILTKLVRDFKRSR